MKMPRNTPNNVLQENFLDVKKESIKSQSMELKVILDDKKNLFLTVRIIVKMAIQPKLMYRFNIIFIKYPNSYFKE